LPNAPATVRQSRLVSLSNLTITQEAIDTRTNRTLRLVHGVGNVGAGNAPITGTIDEL
jgi:hypothetical protein